jgi:ElaB/YqjD/DUF883 family membrane-anchored ribosome-binding protein
VIQVVLPSVEEVEQVARSCYGTALARAQPWRGVAAVVVAATVGQLLGVEHAAIYTDVKFQNW